MTEILFYHLQGQKLASVRLLDRLVRDYYER